MKKNNYLLFLFAILISFYSCSDDNPVPKLTSISPSYSVTKMPTFTLHAYGSDFVSESKIIFNGTEKNTTYVNSTEITCNITSTEIAALTAIEKEYDSDAAINLGDSSVNVSVMNPTPGGGESAKLAFQILTSHQFAIAKNISQTQTESASPKIIIDNSGNVNAAWCEYQTNPYNSEIYLLYSTDNGTNFGNTINVSETDDYSLNPSIAVDISNNIYIAWEEWLPDNTQYDIYFRRATSSGTSWGTKINISNSGWASTNPSIVVNQNGTVFISWLERTYIAGVDKYEIYFSYSIDNGTTWAASTKIAETYCDEPLRLAVSNLGFLAVVWRAGGCSEKGEVYASFSYDQGIQWSAPINISNTASADSTTPDVIFDYSGVIGVAWKDEISGNAEILFSKSLDNGLTWTNPVNISNTAGFSRTPSIKVDLVGNLNCVWMDKTTGNFEILYSRSIDNGTTWTPYTNISNTAAESQNPKLGLNPMGYLFILWVDRTSGNPDIYFNRTKISGVD